MAIPDYQSLMLPLLRILSDQKTYSTKDICKILGEEFTLTAEEEAMLLPSGRQRIFSNRVNWAKTYMGKAGLLESPTRGHVKILEKGLALLGEKPSKIDAKLLRKYPEFVEFQRPRAQSEADELPGVTFLENASGQSPMEDLELAYRPYGETWRKKF